MFEFLPPPFVYPPPPMFVFSSGWCQTAPPPGQIAWPSTSVFVFDSSISSTTGKQDFY